MSDYPSSIYSPRLKENKSGVVYDPAQKTVGYVEDVTKLDAEVVALETLFGINNDGQTQPVEGAVLKGKSGGASKWSTQMFIDNSGNVGIGTTGPSGNLHVLDTDGNARLDIQTTNSGSSALLNVRAPDDGASRIRLGDTSDVDIGEIVYQQGSNYLAFTTNNSEQVRIDSTGKVGIGTTGPTAKLDINSNILRLRTAKTPASAGAAGNAGDICWDSGFLYICVATNTWKKVAIATW